MSLTAGIDVGSTYTKAIVLDSRGEIRGRSLVRTGFKMADAARRAFDSALEEADAVEGEIEYVISTGYGRFQVPFRQANVTDLTAAARGALALFPKTRTVLDIGGQTMKATRLDEEGKVRSFRLNDKCAAGTGAFLEKTARYMGFSTTEIGPLAATSKTAAFISGVCAVFAESEVINHLSQGTAPADIMFGAMTSLVDRSVQLMKRVQPQAEHTLVGGILRFESMGGLIQQKLGSAVNLPSEDLVQFVGALGAAALGLRRLQALAASPNLKQESCPSSSI
jgi:(R)-2-hydroxyacyl-CoA dehydratese activating ATPase